MNNIKFLCSIFIKLLPNKPDPPHINNELFNCYSKNSFYFFVSKFLIHLYPTNLNSYHLSTENPNGLFFLLYIFFLYLMN